MSTPINDGGPAFPVQLADKVSYANQPGMTLRDYFAAAALQGLLACPNCEAAFWESFVGQSYQLADAMIAERAKTKGGAS